MRGGGVGGLGRRGGCSRASKRGERVWRAGRGRWRSSRSREGGGAGRSPRGVAVNVERVGAGGWPRWPLAQRGRRCEGLCGRGKCGHARRVHVLGGRGGTPTATPPSRRTAGRRRAWRRRGHLGCGRRVHQHLRPTLARCFLLLTFFFFFPVCRPPLAGWPRRTRFVCPAGTRTEGEGGRWCAHRVRDGNDGRRQKQMRRRVGSCALAKIPAATRHTRRRAPPPLLAHHPRRNNVSFGHGNGRRHGRQRPSLYGGRGGRQQHASHQRRAVSRGPRQRHVLQADPLRNRIMCKKSVDPHGGRGCSRAPLRPRARGRGATTRPCGHRSWFIIAAGPRQYRMHTRHTCRVGAQVAAGLSNKKTRAEKQSGWAAGRP